MSVLTARAERGSVAFTLIVPALAGGRVAAHAQLAAAIELLRARGLEVDGSVGASDAIVAVSEAWDPRRYDEIVVSTLPMGSSKWLHTGLPERIAHLTDAHVTHVVSQPPKPPVATTTARAHESNPMGPLSVLSWGGHKQR
ncbi:MAG: hypothetical protein M3Y09_02660 [Actinomycetota bacterium]|nr:hypothetical protein [Actinomycetota bacterium]